MDHNDHVALLRPGIVVQGGTWADLGSGSGAFTTALAELIGSDGIIYSVDTDRASLQDQVTIMRHRYPDVCFNTVKANFKRPLDLPDLDGVVMANSLHFVRDKLPVVRAVRSLLKPGGCLLLVEYNADRGNLWVPHPLSFESWRTLAADAGFSTTTQLGQRPSRFMREIYSARSS